MFPQNPGHKKELKVEFDEKILKGLYSNFLIIAHSPSEFILDFAQMMPGFEKAKVGSRIILTPYHAKVMLKTLENNVQKYEKDFGTIQLPKKSTGDDLNFKFNKD